MQGRSNGAWRAVNIVLTSKVQFNYVVMFYDLTFPLPYEHSVNKTSINSLLNINSFLDFLRLQVYFLMHIGSLPPRLMVQKV